MRTYQSTIGSCSRGGLAPSTCCTRPLSVAQRRRALAARTQSHADGAQPAAGGVEGAALAEPKGWALVRALKAFGRQLQGRSAPTPGPGAQPPAPPPSPQPPAASRPPTPTAAAEACPLECLPTTPLEVIRALAPEPIASAASAVRGSLLVASGSGSTPTPDPRGALRRLRGRLSPEAWAVFASEVERAALRAALQHPPAAEPLASLGSIGASWFEDDDGDSDGDGADGTAAAAAVSSGPGQSMALAGGGAPLRPPAPPPAARHDHRHAQAHQPGARDGGPGMPPAAGAWVPQGNGAIYGAWGAFLRSDGLPHASAASAGAAAAAGPQQHFVGQHPITVLPSYGADAAAPAPPGAAVAAERDGGAAPGAPAAGGARAARSSRGARRGMRTAHGPPHFSRLVFGGGGARTLAYAGSVHALRTLGLVRRLECVAGASGGAILAVLVALGLGPQEILSAMATLPDPEQLGWMGLNRNLGLASGAELFAAIEQAVAQRTGVAQPTLGDVEAASGVHVIVATTSLAKRAPLYLDSRTHADMRVRDALRASAAIPFFFSPVRSPFGGDDLLVDGCITDCTPVGAVLGTSDGGAAVDPSSVLVLAVHDAAGSAGAASVAADLNGLVNGLVATALQAGFHHTLRSGVRVLNLFDAVANVDPLQFRMGPALGRDVVARAQEQTERWAVEFCASPAAAAAQAAAAGAHAAVHAAAAVAPSAAAGAPAGAVPERVGGGPVEAGGLASGVHAPVEGGVHVEACAASPDASDGGSASPAASADGSRASSPGQTALHASMGGGGGGGAAHVDAAGQELAYGCDCNPWWLASVDEALAQTSSVAGDFRRLG